MSNANYPLSSTGGTGGTGGNGGPVGMGMGTIAGTSVGPVTANNDYNYIYQIRGVAAPVAQSRVTLIGSNDIHLELTSPPPNALRRLIWRVALGVVWKDLRPERALEELAKLK